MKLSNARLRPSVTLFMFGAMASPILYPQATLYAAPSAQATITVQAGNQGKKISTDLFGIFFEDINYAADGGLYAELIQNRSFEYSAQDNGAWNSLTAWELVTCGGGKRMRALRVGML